MTAEEKKFYKKGYKEGYSRALRKIKCDAEYLNSLTKYPMEDLVYEDENGNEITFEDLQESINKEKEHDK